MINVTFSKEMATETFLKDLKPGFFTGSIGSYRKGLFLCVEAASGNVVYLIAVERPLPYDEISPFTWNKVWNTSTAPFENYQPVDVEIKVLYDQHHV